MNVNELHALTQQFADAFDQLDLKTVMEMLSEDVEVFDHHRGHHLSELRLPTAIVPRVQRYVGIVNACDMFMGVTKEGKARSIHGRTTLVFIKQSGQWKIVSAHFSAMP